MKRRDFVKVMGAAPLLLTPQERSRGNPGATPIGAEPLRRIAFGSCAQQDQPQPIWDAVLAENPELFLFIGDNIYGDTTDMEVLRAKYRMLAAHSGYQRLRATTQILATWDDHDYGANDAGAEYPMKEESKQVFLEFFDVPLDSPRRVRRGIHDAQVFGPPGQRVQVILLDMRYFRSPTVRIELSAESRELGFGPYVANRDPRATLLGQEQWEWLARQLEVPAEVRLIVSSIQVISFDHGWEAWGQFPLERQRLFGLIRAKRASGVLFLSGDVHWGELSRHGGGAYPLYDFTSSALNQDWPKALNLPNPHRVGTVVYPYPNFGMVEIDWQRADPTIDLRLHRKDGQPVLAHQIRLSELQTTGWG